jgi:glycosyltransferase involved in cell wall biosynthesis
MSNVLTDKFTFHLVSLVHLPQSRQYTSCAFTQKNLKLAKMLTTLGHTVYFYGSEGSDVGDYVDSPNFHFIQTHTLADIRQAWGDGDNRFEIGYDWTSTDFRHDFNSKKKEATEKFYEVCIREIKRLSQPDHFLLCTMGSYQNPIRDSCKLFLTTEPGIGYRGSVQGNFRSFESSYIQNFTYGSEHPYESLNGSYYDRVIPNYFDPNDFEFSEKKENYLLYVGRMIKRKGLMTAYLVSEETGIPLKIAGQGAHVLPDGSLEAIRQTDFHIPKGNWEYLGFAGIPERKKLFAKARASFVATEYLECFGGTHVESMLSGTPPITTNFAVFPETIPDYLNGKVGFRCNTLDDFVKAAIASKDVDHMFIRQYAEKFLMDSVAVEFDKWFRDLYCVYESSIDTSKKGWHRIHPKV